MLGLGINQSHFTAAPQQADPSDFTYPFWPKCVTFRLAPYLLLIHLIPCCWGSMIRGQRAQCVRIVAFSVDILSLGSPSLFQAAIVASSVNMAIKSRPSVIGIETLKSELNVTHCCSGRATLSALQTRKRGAQAERIHSRSLWTLRRQLKLSSGNTIQPNKPAIYLSEFCQLQQSTSGSLLQLSGFK